MKTITTKKARFVDLYSGLHSVKTLKNKKLALVAGKNMNILNESLRDLEEANAPSEEFMKLANKVNVITNANSEDGRDQITKLEEENKELVEQRRSQLAAVKKLMEDELTLDLHTISEDDLPNEVNAEQVVLLDLILNEK